MSSIGNNIRMFREQKGLSQQDLAFKIRVGSRTIEKYEEGISIPDTNAILKISTALDIPASELLVTNEYLVTTVDKELEALLNKVGFDRAKFILEKTKDLSEDEFSRLLQLL